VVGSFDNHREIFRGQVHHNSLNGTALIDVTAERSGVKGSGNSYVTYIPPFSMGEGQMGRAKLKFDDGRIVFAEWTSLSLTTGYGHGKDQFGNTFKFTFGMTEAEAEAYVDSLKSSKAGLPELPPPYRPKETRKEKGYATGTGFFISKEGHLITNFHVIEDSQDISITLQSGQTLPAKVIKSDPANDVALLKVELASTPLKLSDKSEKGDQVLTIGFPLISTQGKESKVTFGNINALSGVQGDVRFLQIDVPIQPGNSGGPLINEDGDVIGIVTATLNAINELKRSGALPQNVNYAVKSDYVLPLIKDVSTIEKANHAPMKRKEVIELSNKAVVLVIAK
jgi:S1-C subfamily serine protease